MANQATARRPAYVLAVLMAIYVFSTLDRFIMGVLAEPIRRELHITDTEIGILTGFAFALFYTGFGIPVGWLADRFGRTRVIAVACTIWSLCSAGGALAGSFATLALSRVGVGIGEAGGTAPSYSLISDHFPPAKRATAFGIFGLGSAIALLVSGSIGAWIAREWGWRWALAVVSLPGLACALLLWLTVPEPVRAEQATAGPGAGGQSSPVTSIRKFVSSPLLLLTATASGLCAFSTYSLMAWLPALLMRAKGMAMGDIAVWYGPAVGVSAAIGISSSGWLADRWGRRDVRSNALLPLLANVVIAGCVALASAIPGWHLALVFGVIATGLSQMFISPLLTIIQNNSPAAERSVYSALFLLVNNLIGAACGPLYIGMISDRLAAIGYRDPLVGAFAALAPIGLIAAAVLWQVARRLRMQAEARS